jgi:predicted nucleic-acid-binding Zn-ribbon protein
MKEGYECWDCGELFEFDWDDTHVSCDIIEGQYTEFIAIMCPHCGIENRW